MNKSAARALDLLTLLSKNRLPMSLLEIEKAMDIPKSSTFELVYTLADKGFIEHEDKGFCLGIEAFKVGIAYAAKLELVRLSKEIVDSLARESRQTVFLARYVDDQMVYVDKQAQYADTSSTCGLGSTKPLYCTALGKSILAAQTDAEIDAYFSRTITPKLTENTIDNSEDMKSAVLLYKRQGYVTEDCEGSSNMCCVACPVFDWSNKAIAAVSIAVPKYEITEECWPRLGKLVSDAALLISKRLGYSDNRIL